MMRNILRYLAPLIGWMFAHMSFAIPVKRLRETDTLMAFHHPKPAYPFHVLLVPKNQIASLEQPDPRDSALLADIFSAVQSLVKEFKLPAYRLIVNGGEFQDFPHLHFHLISPSPCPFPQQERGKT
jgi:histidine triad (HIT) family protein